MQTHGHRQAWQARYRWSLLALLAAMQQGCSGAEPAAHSTGAPEVEAPASQGKSATGPADAAAQPAEVPTPTSGPEPVAPAAPPPDYLAFDGACGKGPRALVGVVGDVLMHHELQRQAVAHRLRYRSIWAGILDLLQVPDVTYANLEGPLAPGLNKQAQEVPDPGLEFDEVVYTGYPRFNFHPEIAVDLRRSGIDVVSTANNHAFDRGSAGIDRTIDSLRAGRLKYTGTRKSSEADYQWHAVTRAGSLRIAWIACTAFTNLENHGEAEQVLRCNNHADEIAALITKLADQRSIDAVIVTPHWGKEYTTGPADQLRRWAHQWLDAGAVAVVGSHPHVLQPWEKYVAKDGRETFILYSLGNFASHQPELERRSTALVYFGLVRGRGRKRRARITGVRYVPLHVRQSGSRFYVEAIDRVGGPADARAHIASVLGPFNAIHPDDNFVMDPQCDDSWQPRADPRDYLAP